MKQVSNRVRPTGQRGFTFWTLVTNGVLLAVVLLFALRVLPGYMEYMTVRDVVERAAQDYDPKTQTLQDLRTKIQKLLTTSSIYDIKAADMEIYRENRVVFINANYETRFPMFWIIEGVMTFDDLVIEAGPQASVSN
jgi:cell division protein FtsL